MRLNWCLKHAPGVGEKYLPITIESYTTQYGFDLFIPALLRLYREVLLSKPTDQELQHFAGGAYDSLKYNCAQYSTRDDRSRMWMGLSISFMRDKNLTPVDRRNFQPGDLILEFQGLAQNLISQPYRVDTFELRISKHRYTNYCPLEYYYTTHDIPDIE